MVDIFIENIIASADMGGDLDLDGIIKQFPNCEYNPGQFPGVVFRPDKPKVVMLFFNDGRIMVTAAKSVEDVENSINMAEKELKEKGLILPSGTKKEQPAQPAGEPAEIPAEAPVMEPGNDLTEEVEAETEAEPGQEAEEADEDTAEEEEASEDESGEDESGEDESGEDESGEDESTGKKKKKKKADKKSK